MRNPVARNDHNRAAVHTDRTKCPPNTVDEGLLDYYAENAQDVAQSVYDGCRVRLFIGDEEIKSSAGETMLIKAGTPEVDWDNCMIGKNELGEIEVFECPEEDLLSWLDQFHDCKR